MILDWRFLIGLAGRRCSPGCFLDRKSAIENPQCPRKRQADSLPEGNESAFLGVVRLSAGRTYFFDLALVERLAVFRAVVFFLAAVFLGDRLAVVFFEVFFLAVAISVAPQTCGVSTFSIMALPRGRPG